MRMMQKRTLALLLALCLLLSAAFAEAPTAQPQSATPVPATAQPVTPEPVATKNSETTAPAETKNTQPEVAGTQAVDGGSTSAPSNSAPSTEPEPDDGANTTAPTTGATASPAPDGDAGQTTDGPSPSSGATASPTPDGNAGQTTDGPSPSSSATPTPDGEATPTPTPSDEATPTPTPTAGETTPAPAGEGPAWYWDGEQKHYGELEELLLLTEETIYIASDELFTLTGEAALLAQEAEFALDAEVFPEEEYILYISDVGPNGETQEDTIYLWAGKEEDAPPTPTPSTEPEPTDPVEIEAELLVVPEMYRAGAWSSTAPSFTLTVVPDTLTGYTFALSVDDGGAQAVESPCVFTTEGQHTLVFYLIDASGAQAARSTTYTVWLDTAAPEAQAQFDMQTGALTVTATDAISGVDAISLDGGKTWQTMTAAEDGSFVYTAPLTAQVAAGELMVRDAAGNCWQSAESYGVPGGMGGDFGGMGGFGGGSFSGMGGFSGGGFSGGGSSGTTRTVSHSSGSEEEATLYGAVALEVEEGDMFVLTLGGEELPLTLTLDYDANDSEDAYSAFTAELAVWNGEEGDEDCDTLILTASADAASPYAFRWDFTGDVYKTLLSSGVQYLVLRVGERVTALSTAGFTAGTAYNTLKSEGAASSEFAYSLWMGDPDPALEMEVEARGERYLLEAGEGDMYYYDVYTGDMDMLNAAFGAASQEER